VIRIIIIAALISVLCKVTLGKWPWEYLQNTSPRKQELARARSLLGVRTKASHGEIIEAHRRLIAVVHPDKGGTSDQVHEANAARDLLLGNLPTLPQERP